MYDFWEWEGRGYIAMKKMKGSLGDVLYDPAQRGILNELRSNEAVLAELVKEVFTSCNKLKTDLARIGPLTFAKHYLSRYETR